MLRLVCYIKILIISFVCFTTMVLADTYIPPKAWATQVDPSFNFFRITPLLYRSALPNSQNIELLERNNIRTIITFVKNDDKKWAKQHHFKLVSYPVHADRVDDDDVVWVLRKIQQAQSKGGAVLIHCKHGQNRTGLFAAMYRIVIQHWSKQDALDELKNAGFGSVDDMEDAIAYIEDADVVGIRYALAYNQCSTSKIAFCQLLSLL